MQRNVKFYLVEVLLYNDRANEQIHCTLKVPVKYAQDEIYKKLLKECQGTHLHVLSVGKCTGEEVSEIVKLPEILTLNLTTLL